MRFIADGSILSEQQARDAIARFENEWDEEGFGLFAVEHRQSERLIGFAGLSRPDFLPEVLPSVEIGWRFAKTHWGMGYATVAATAALAFGVGELGLHDIVSIFQLGNIASERIMQKLGMVFKRHTIDPTCNRKIGIYRLPQA